MDRPAGLSAADWDRRYSDSALLWSAEPNRFVAAALAQAPPGRALDLAAGEGRNAVWLAGRGWRVTAVDFSATGLDKGKRLATARGVEVTWVLADLAQWTLPASAFEAVVLAYFHPGAALVERVLHAAAGALTPGGLLVLVGHDRSNLTEGHGGPQDPALLYTARELTAALPGLDVEQADRVDRPVSTPEGEAVARDTLVTARRPVEAGG